MRYEAIAEQEVTVNQATSIKGIHLCTTSYHHIRRRKASLHDSDRWFAEDVTSI
jgi:hypothetical protein